MSSYESLNDYEIISMARELNEDAIQLLHDKYIPLINKKCRKYLKYLCNKGVELDDLIQECLISFEEAINTFNSKDNVTFYTFVCLCIDRQLINVLNRNNRDKHKLLNESIPLESFENDDNTNLIDLIQDNSNNPEATLLSGEEFNDLCTNIMNRLTFLEECVFKLKIQGFNYKEIADILDKDDKSIDNAIQRIKTKIKLLVEK